MPLTTLIVDDEPIARRVLREELETLEGVQVLGEADHGDAALTMVHELKPDLLFLDLQMPEMTGFDVIRGLPDGRNAPVVVIVTAFDEHAIKAFEAGAIDYLLKPVNHERMCQAVERARRLIKESGVSQQQAKLHEISDAASSTQNRKIVGRSGEEFVLLKPEEVLAFQADGDLVWIITAQKRFLATQTLRTLQQRLQNTSFRRIHRNALVNLDHVRKLSTLTSQRWLVTLFNNLEFVVSKRQARTVRDLLTW